MANPPMPWTTASNVREMTATEMFLTDWEAYPNAPSWEDRLEAIEAGNRLDELEKKIESGELSEEENGEYR